MPSLPDSRLERKQRTVVSISFALSGQARFTILNLLLGAETEGLTVGQIAKELSVPPSSLSHHMGILKESGLINQVVEGRETRCFPDRLTLDSYGRLVLRLADCS